MGDFDGDGFSDLAIGSSDAPVGAAKQHAGFVRVIYGSERGLDVARSQRWTQNSPGVADKAESNDGYGNALAAADFGLGTQDDLAVGIHGENHDAGAVHVLYGTPEGLSADRNQLWTQASPGVADEPETDDAFGLTLTPGQFHDSGFFDLAIGVYNESVGEAYSTGAVHVLNGSRNGLTADGSVFLTQDLPEDDGPALGAAFSVSMAAGRFSGGPTDDLAVGAPFTRNRSGTVHVYRGTADGLRTDNPQVWSQATPGVAGRPESDDTFGSSLATGQFGRDVGERQFEDLAVRVPGEETDSTDAGGAVMVIYGSPSGLTAAGSRTFTKEFRSESYGIDVTWSQQLTAVRGAGGLDRLVVGDDEWVHVMTPGSTGLGAGSQQTWTAKSLGHPEVWTGLADAVGG